MFFLIRKARQALQDPNDPNSSTQGRRGGRQGRRGRNRQYGQDPSGRPNAAPGYDGQIDVTNQPVQPQQPQKSTWEVWGPRLRLLGAVFLPVILETLDYTGMKTTFPFLPTPFLLTLVLQLWRRPRRI